MANYFVTFTKNYSFPYFQKLLTWFLPRPPSFWSVSGNCFFGFLGGVLLWFFFYFSNSFSTFLTDSLLALLPPAKCYCFAMFYTRSSLFSLKIPAPPPQLQENTVCQRPSFQFCKPIWGAMEKGPEVASTPRGCDLTWWVGPCYISKSPCLRYTPHVLLFQAYFS